MLFNVNEYILRYYMIFIILHFQNDRYICADVYSSKEDNGGAVWKTINLKTWINNVYNAKCDWIMYAIKAYDYM